MESSYRNYLVTGRSELLQPYEQGRQDYHGQLAQLRSLTDDNPAQAARWQNVEAQIESWERNVAEPGITLRRARAGAGADADLIKLAGSEDGRLAFDRMKQLFSAAH